MYDVLTKFIEICNHKQEQAKVEKYEEVKSHLKKALNTSGWDGRWLKRAYTDNRSTIRKY